MPKEKPVNRDRAISAIPVLGSPIQQVLDLNEHGTTFALDRGTWMAAHPLTKATSLGSLAAGALGAPALMKHGPARLTNKLTQWNTKMLGRHASKMMPNLTARIVASLGLSMAANSGNRAYLSGNYTQKYGSMGTVEDRDRQQHSRMMAGLAAAMPELFNMGYRQGMPIDTPVRSITSWQDAAHELRAFDGLMDVADKERVPVLYNGDGRHVPDRRKSMLGDLLRGSGPHYMPTDSRMGRVAKWSLLPYDEIKKKPSGIVNFGKNSPTSHILAHELGHHFQPEWMKDRAVRAGLKLGPLLGGATPVFSDDETTGIAGAAAGTAAAIPGLIGEYDASARGKKMWLKALGEEGASRLKGLSKHGPFAGLPTYMSHAAMPALAYLGRKLSGGYEKSKSLQDALLSR